MGLGAAEFDFLRQFMFANSAMVIDADKAYLAESRLASLVHQEKLPSIDHLVQQLQRDSYGPLKRKIVDALTNHETWFFRDVEPFELLKKVLLPEARERKGSAIPVTVWSAAASSGQEACSIAMTAREMWADAGNRVRIFATDVSYPVLEKAKMGRYSQFEVNRGLPAAMLTRHFRREGLEWQIRDEVRSMIDYRQLNLAEPWPAIPPIDIVFLRNVLIYFNDVTKREIMQRVHRALEPGGVLLLGAAETTLGLHSGFERLTSNRINYYKKVKG